jgi:osmotically inducible protein OsmC
MISKEASAKWQGNLKEGKGQISTGSGALAEQPYGFNTRFEDKAGTNPEELIGAAHAACFTMALSMMLGEEKLKAESLETKAKVYLEEKDGGFAIPKVELSLRAKVPDADKSKVEEIAHKAKEGCPVSKLLNCEINLKVEII